MAFKVLYCYCVFIMKTDKWYVSTVYSYMKIEDREMAAILLQMSLRTLYSSMVHTYGWLATSNLVTFMRKKKKWVITVETLEKAA